MKSCFILPRAESKTRISECLFSKMVSVLIFFEIISYILFILSLLIAIIVEFRIESITQNFSLVNYTLAIMLVLSGTTSISFLIKKLFNFLKQYAGGIPYFNNYFYLALAVMLATFVGGFFYISVISKDRLKDFLLILSLSIFNSFAAVSALKSITKIN